MTARNLATILCAVTSAAFSASFIAAVLVWAVVG